MKKQRKVGHAVMEALEYLRELRYSDEMVKKYRIAWDKIIQYASDKGVVYFSPHLLDDFITAKKLTIFTAHYSDTPQGKLYRAVRTLGEITEAGVHTARITYRETPCYPPFIVKSLREIRDYMHGELNLAPSTIYGHFWWLNKYLLHRLAKPGFTSWGCLSEADTSSFIRSLNRFALSTRSRAMESIKSVFKVLCAMGEISAHLYKNIPRFRRYEDSILRPIWPADEVKRFLKAADRTTKSGKRNYAIFILATNLGLRAGDIRGLTLDNIDWEQSRLELVQRKTRQGLYLPLSTTVGEALIDYLLNARPESSHREVFLQCNAPFGPLSQGRSFSSEVKKLREIAKLPLMPGLGLHSFRRSLATNMLECGASAQNIAAVLGHSDLDSIKSYLRVSIPSLYQAALEPDDEVAYA